MENDCDLLDWQTNTSEGSHGMFDRNEGFIISLEGNFPAGPRGEVVKKIQKASIKLGVIWRKKSAKGDKGSSGSCI